MFPYIHPSHKSGAGPPRHRALDGNTYPKKVFCLKLLFIRVLFFLLNVVILCAGDDLRKSATGEEVDRA